MSNPYSEQLAEAKAKANVDSARAADEAYRGRIHAEIMDDLANVCGPDSLPKVLMALADGKIRHLKIIY